MLLGLKYTQNKLDVPVRNVTLEKLEGEALDYENLNTEDFSKVKEKAVAHSYNEFNEEIVMLTKLQLFNFTYRYAPNIAYVSKSYKVKKKLFEGMQVIKREELNPNEFLFVYSDKFSFPCYKDDKNNVTVLNEGLAQYLKIKEK